MFAMTHALTAGFVATKIPSPFLSYPLAFILHLAMDEIPHWDFGTIAEKKLRRYVPLGITDLIIALASCWIIFQKGFAFKPLLWGGIFFGLLPDFLQAATFIFGFKLAFLNRLNHFRKNHSHHHPDFLEGLILQIIIVGLIFAFR